MRKLLPVHWDEATYDELIDIYNFIKIKSPQNAIHVINSLLELGDSLGSFPEKYPRDRFINKKAGNIRSVSKWSYKIIYEISDDVVIIASVVNTNDNPDVLYKEF